MFRDLQQEEIINILQNKNMRLLHNLRYPPIERAVDYIVEQTTRGEKIFLKFAEETSTRSKIYQEIKMLSDTLKINSLLVTDKLNNREVMQDVIYIRNRVGIVSKETFLRYLNNEKIFVYEFNGMFYVKINGKKLKKLRERKGLRIHELARLVGISAKTIREYEEGNMDMTIEKASRFFDVLGKDFEDVIEEIDISSFRIIGKSRKEHVRTKNMVKRMPRDERLKIAEKFKELGLDASLYDAIPSDVVLVNRSEESKKFFISYVSKNILMNEAEIKCRENFSFAKALDAVSIIVVNDDVPRDFLIEVEKYGVTSRLTELNSLAKEIVSELRR